MQKTLGVFLEWILRNSWIENVLCIIALRFISTICKLIFFLCDCEREKWKNELEKWKL